MYNIIHRPKYMEGSSNCSTGESFLKMKSLVVDSTGHWSSTSYLKSNNHIFVKTQGVTTSSVFSLHCNV